VDVNADPQPAQHSYFDIAFGVCSALVCVAAAYLLWAGARNDVPSEYVAGDLLVGLIFLAFAFSIAARARAAKVPRGSRFVFLWSAIFYAIGALLALGAAFSARPSAAWVPGWAVWVLLSALLVGIILSPFIAAFANRGTAGRRTIVAGLVAVATYVIGYGAAILYPERMWIVAVTMLATFAATMVFIVYFAQASVLRLKEKAAASDLGHSETKKERN
jgi:hypothetical protein